MREQRLFLADRVEPDAWEPPGVTARKAAKSGELVDCQKCSGSGKLPEYKTTTNHGGCAPCRGSGKVSPGVAAKIAAELDAKVGSERDDD